jgi:hypothetical protein
MTVSLTKVCSYYGKCHYVDCRILFIVMLNVVMLKVVMLSVVTPFSRQVCFSLLVTFTIDKYLPARLGAYPETGDLSLPFCLTGKSRNCKIDEIVSLKNNYLMKL